MKHRFIFILPVLMFLLPASLFAQFEGAISFRFVNLDKPAEESRYELTASKNRLFLQSENQVQVMQMMNASGLLVRSDLDDFVLIDDENQALTLKNSDINRMISMFDGSEDKTSKSFDWENRVTATGNRRTIQGYEAEEMLLKSNDNETISIWLSEEIKLNWGILIDFWNTTGKSLTDEELPIELVMNNNSFPLLIEFKKNDQLKAKAEVYRIDRGRFNRDKLEIPKNAEVIGLSDLMMNMFRNR